MSGQGAEQKGDWCELMAAAYFRKNNYLVFTRMSGPIDLVLIHQETGETRYIDVKYKNTRQGTKGQGTRINRYVKSSLKNLDFRSIYHHKTKEDYGSEKEPTFFHTKKESKSYHIDYLFLKGMEAKNIDIGLYSDWIELSDHMPLVCEI